MTSRERMERDLLGEWERELAAAVNTVDTLTPAVAALKRRLEAYRDGGSGRQLRLRQRSVRPDLRGQGIPARDIGASPRFPR